MLTVTFKSQLSRLYQNKLLFIQKYIIIVFHIKFGILK